MHILKDCEMRGKLPKRKRLRLQNYDYTSAGTYFVTICTRNKQHLFSNIHEGTVQLNPAGKMVEKTWKQLEDRFPNIKLDEFIIMPNHIHGIITLAGAPLVNDNVNIHKDIGALFMGARKHNNVNIRADTRPAPTLGDIICAFKSITTNDYIYNVKYHNWFKFPWKLWQRNYYDHIIRKENELNQIRQYITDNPAKWDQDPENI